MIPVALNISSMSTWSRDGVRLNCDYEVSGTFQSGLILLLHFVPVLSL